MLTDHTTLAQFLIESRRSHPEATGDLDSLILDVALACKAIANLVAQGALRNALGKLDQTNVQGEVQHKVDVLSNDYFIQTNERSGLLAGMASEEMDDPYTLPVDYPRGKYLLLFDPLDGSSNIDVNVSVGSIFSVLRAPTPGENATVEDFLQPGTEQVAAGYALYGPSVLFVLTVGRGVQVFTLDPALGEFILTRESMEVPNETNEFAINSSNRRFWEPAITRYIDECLVGKSGPRKKDYNMRWVASLVAETHRILTRGGVFLYPKDTKDPSKPGRLRLMYEANPISFIIEQAGGLSSTGRERVMEVTPTGLHQRVPFIFGTKSEVERIDDYHRNHNDKAYDSPMFGDRGLFRSGTN